MQELIPEMFPSPMKARIPTSESFIIQLKCHSVEEHVLNKKRAKKELTLKEGFDLDQEGSIFVNDFLPPILYNLSSVTQKLVLRI